MSVTSSHTVIIYWAGIICEAGIFGQYWNSVLLSNCPWKTIPIYPLFHRNRLQFIFRHTSVSSTYSGQSVGPWYFRISILSASLSPHKASRRHCGGRHRFGTQKVNLPKLFNKKWNFNLIYNGQMCHKKQWLVNFTKTLGFPPIFGNLSQIKPFFLEPSLIDKWQWQYLFKAQNWNQLYFETNLATSCERWKSGCICNCGCAAHIGRSSTHWVLRAWVGVGRIGPGAIR